MFCWRNAGIWLSLAFHTHCQNWLYWNLYLGNWLWFSFFPPLFSVELDFKQQEDKLQPVLRKLHPIEETQVAPLPYSQESYSSTPKQKSKTESKKHGRWKLWFLWVRYIWNLRPSLKIHRHTQTQTQRKSWIFLKKIHLSRRLSAHVILTVLRKNSVLPYVPKRPLYLWTNFWEQGVKVASC